MQTPPRSNVIPGRVWRDLAGLAAEALAIGVLFSLLLALAVLVMTRGRADDRFAAVPPAATATSVATPRQS